MAETGRKNFKVEPMQAHTLTWWRSRQSKIDMDPPYQRRGRLWSPTDKAYLIDSILNGYDVPKLYMADFTWGDSTLNKRKVQYAIIDGKQRIESIFDFFDGKFVLNKDFVYLEDPTLELSGLGYQDLKTQYPQVAEIFDEYNPLVMRVVAQDEDPINELFVRLNRSKPLTGAEIRNAMTGPAPEVIREIAKHEFFKVNVAFTVSRGQDLNAAAKVLYFEYFEKLGETKKSTLNEFVKEAAKQSKRDRLELAGRKVVDLLDDMNEIFLPKDRLLASAGIFPVYYWFVRARGVKEYPLIREFLVRFEERRRENRNLISENPKNKKIDQELVLYDEFNRSTNDLQSHDGRISILEERFKTFAKSKKS
jgi:Protein of unknown function DUF262